MLETGSASSPLDSLCFSSGSYRHRADGSLFYVAERPGADWYAHGTTPRLLTVLRRGRVRRVLLHKQRWRHRHTGETRHDRPPDDIAWVRACSLVVVVALAAWVTGSAGLQQHHPVVPDLADVPSRRTLQRWLARALPLARLTAQAIRHAVVDKSEPRPVESLVSRGRSPPASRRWRDPAAVWILSGALTALLSGAARLRCTAARLLAGARRRWTGPEDRFVI